MRRHILSVLFLLGPLTPLLSGHEIKVFSSQYSLKAGGKATIYLAWGHRLPVDELIDGKTIERYGLVHPTSRFQAFSVEDLSLQAVLAVVNDPGIYQAVVQRKPSIRTFVIDADGNKVLVRGPKNAVKGGKVDSSQRSFQFGKALLVVGMGNSDKKIEPVGHALELVPLVPSNHWRTDKECRVQVLFQGKPIPGIEVSAGYIGQPGGEGWPITLKTDSQGTILFHPNRPGIWVLKANHKEAAVGEALRQYDLTSYTATLSLEIQP